MIQLIISIITLLLSIYAYLDFPDFIPNKYPQGGLKKNAEDE